MLQTLEREPQEDLTTQLYDTSPAPGRQPFVSYKLSSNKILHPQWLYSIWKLTMQKKKIINFVNTFCVYATCPFNKKNKNGTNLEKHNLIEIGF